MFQSLKKNLIAGLMTLLPIAMTIALAAFLIDLFTAPFVHLVSAILAKMPIFSREFLFLSSEQTVRYVSKILILISLFFFTVGLGILARWIVVRFLLSITDKILHKIPVINTIYKASQELAKTVFKKEKSSFQQVVIVPFPHKNAYALGLVSQGAPEIGPDMVSVLVPTSPLPTSGFLLMYEKSALIYTDMKPEAALKYIISGSLLTPESFRRSS